MHSSCCQGRPGPLPNTSNYCAALAAWGLPLACNQCLASAYHTLVPTVLSHPPALAGMGKSCGGSVAGSVEVQQTVRVGKLNLVDLAGSERVHITGGPIYFCKFWVASSTWWTWLARSACTSQVGWAGRLPAAPILSPVLQLFSAGF